MEGDYIHFHQIVDDTLADIIKELREFTNTVDHVDVEKLLQRWRMMDGYFKDTKSWEEVLIQERLIWNQLTVIVPLPWITRKEHLMILLRRPEMGFTDSVIDQKLVALDDSEDYYVWCKHVEHLFKLASIKSLKFRGVTEPARCKYCRRTGHTVEECRTARSHLPPQPEHHISQSNDPLSKVAPTNPAHSHPTNNHNTSSNTSQSQHWRSDKIVPGHNGQPKTSELPKRDTQSNRSHPPKGDSQQHAQPHRSHPQTNPVLLTTELSIAPIILHQDHGKADLLGLVDCGSTVCYVTRQALALMENVKTPRSRPSLIQTMTGKSDYRDMEVVDICLSILDDEGTQSVFVDCECLIHEGSTIPGSPCDFLLSAGFIKQIGLTITGTPNGLRLILPRPHVVDSATDTNHEAVCMFSIQFDAPEEMDDDLEEPLPVIFGKQQQLLYIIQAVLLSF